ncbi:MAG: hypothetical protein AAFX08_04520 [Pseudomonadota bacterium]
MGLIGAIALLGAIAVAGLALLQSARSGDDGAKAEIVGVRTVTLLKLAAWLGLAAVLFAAKLFPVALMILLAAGGVTAIEIWRERTVRDDLRGADEYAENAAGGAAATTSVRSDAEAASILGVEPGASADEVKAAHKRLIARLHPDQGGNDYLAAQINAARDRLARKAETETRIAEQPVEDEPNPPDEDPQPDENGAAQS